MILGMIYGYSAQRNAHVQTSKRETTKKNMGKRKHYTTQYVINMNIRGVRFLERDL